MYGKLVGISRVLLGLQLVINGFNWWVKIITPYPSIVDYIDTPPRADLVGALIMTGFMFHVVKGVELLCGIGLLANRYVPLLLVLSMPIAVPIFMVDVLMSGHLRAVLMGSTALLANIFLLLAYFSRYRSMLDAKNQPDNH